MTSDYEAWQVRAAEVMARGEQAMLATLCIECGGVLCHTGDTCWACRRSDLKHCEHGYTVPGRSEVMTHFGSKDRASTPVMANRGD